MERRCQEVIDRCWQLGDANPILFIHDVGAGGLSNAMPELVSDGGRGGKFELRDILSDEPGMSRWKSGVTNPRKLRAGSCCRSVTAV